MPDRDPQAQRRTALGLASEARAARSELKQRLAAGAISAADVLDATPREADGMALWDLVRSQPGWGEARSARFFLHAQRLLGDSQIRREATIGSLTEGDRAALLRLLAATTMAEGHPAR